MAEDKKDEKNGLIEDAKVVAEKLEGLKNEMSELLAKREELLAQEKLSGKSFAGQPIVKEETAKDYAEGVMSGRIKAK